MSDFRERAIALVDEFAGLLKNGTRSVVELKASQALESTYKEGLKKALELAQAERDYRETLAERTQYSSNRDREHLAALGAQAVERRIKEAMEGKLMEKEFKIPELNVTTDMNEAIKDALAQGTGILRFTSEGFQFIPAETIQKAAAKAAERIKQEILEITGISKDMLTGRK